MEISQKAERSESVGVPVPIVYSWGRSDFGSLFCKPGDDHIDGVYQFQSTRTIMQMSSNVYHSAAVTSTGEIYTCGENYDGQVAPKCAGASEDENEHKRPRILDLLGGQQRITFVSCGLTHTVCVTASGCAITFGGNECGQLGHTPNSITTVPPKMVNFQTHSGGVVSNAGGILIRKAAAGDLFSLFLTTSGEVYGCGSASYLGNPIVGDASRASNVTSAQRVESLASTHIMDLVAGSAHALALTGSGDLFGWGDNLHCQLGFNCRAGEPVAGASGGNNAAETHQQTPRRVEGLLESFGKVVGLSAGYHHSVIWTDSGLLLGTGANKYGQLGMLLPRAEAFTTVPLPHPCLQAACGSNHTIALCRTTGAFTVDAAGLGSGSNDLSTEDSILYGFGANNNGQITSADAATMFRTPTVLSTIATAYNTPKVICIAAGGDQSFAIGFAGAPEDDRLTGAAVPGGLLRKQFSTLTSKATMAMTATQLMFLLSAAKDALTGKDGRPLLGHADSPPVVEALNTASELFATPSLLAGSFECPSFSDQGRAQRKVATAAQRAVQYRLLQEHKPSDYPRLPSLASNPEYDHTVIYAHRTAAVEADVGQLTIPENERRIKLPELDIDGVEECYVTLMQLGSSATARLLAAVQQSITELEYAAATIPAGESLPDSALRVIMILWQAPIMAVPTLSNHIFARLLKIAQPLQKKLQVMCAMYPAHLFVARLLKPLHAHLAYALQFDNHRILEANNTPLLCEALSWLQAVNTIYKLAPPEAFNNEKLASLPDTTLVSDCFTWRKYCEAKAKGTPNLSDPPFLISRYPFLLSVETKKKLLLIEDTILMQHYQQEALRLAVMTGATTVQPFFILPIEREHLLQHALLHISNASPLDLRKPLKVMFIGEEGVDEGGVKKEFFQLLVTQLFSVQYGMFLPAPSGRCTIINMSNTYSEAEFRLVGVLLGLAVYNNVILDIHFPLVLYKLLLEQNVTLEDLAPIDPELYKGLHKLLRFTPAAQVEDVFCRTFVTEWDEFGAKREHDLIPDGRNVAVTGENRFLYVDRLVQWMLKDSITTQFAALKEGFGSVMSRESLMLLTAEELQSVMVGTPHLDFKELQLTTEYVGPDNWTAENPTVRKFWQIVHSLSFEEKQKFLLFVTGSSKAPLGGLRNIRLRIQRMGPHSNLLPTAHTCFNTLLLPEYDCDSAAASENDAAAAVPAVATQADGSELGGAVGLVAAAADGVVRTEDGGEHPIAERGTAMTVIAADAAAAEVGDAPAPAPAESPSQQADSAVAAQTTSAPASNTTTPATTAMSTEEFIRDRLLKAISECEGFGLK